MRPEPLNVPVGPSPLSVMVSVSVAPVLGSLMVTLVPLAKGWIGASDVVVCPATVPVMVGATAGSVLITVVVLLTVGVGSTLLLSVSVKVVAVLDPRAPAFGVKASASNSLVMVAADAAANV